MTKADLIERLATKADLPRPRAEEILNHVLDDITDGLKRGDKVNISGFGTFTVSNRKARTGRNPKTGEPIDIPATRSAKFRAGKNLRDSMVGS
ncbi:MAG: DNA-binding protein HU-beta [Candidatus Binatota bacterium]|jgi:DNA-binding protein HU-beta|nr:DNA-binding protein HU-beta [Candidatus Binatota bacterium]